MAAAQAEIAAMEMRMRQSQRELDEVKRVSQQGRDELVAEAFHEAPAEAPVGRHAVARVDGGQRGHADVEDDDLVRVHRERREVVGVLLVPR